MAEYVERFVTSRVASGNLDGSQYCFVRQIGNVDVLTVPTTGGYALGVLQNKPQNNEHAGVAFLGSTKIKLANSLGAGIPIMSAVSGYAVQAASGQVVLGYLMTGASSGGVGELLMSISHAGSL